MNAQCRLKGVRHKTNAVFAWLKPSTQRWFGWYSLGALSFDSERLRRTCSHSEVVVPQRSESEQSYTGCRTSCLSYRLLQCLKWTSSNKESSTCAKGADRVRVAAQITIRAPYESGDQVSATVALITTRIQHKGEWSCSVKSKGVGVRAAAVSTWANKCYKMFVH